MTSWLLLNHIKHALSSITVSEIFKSPQNLILITMLLCQYTNAFTKVKVSYIFNPSSPLFPNN